MDNGVQIKASPSLSLLLLHMFIHHKVSKKESKAEDNQTCCTLGYHQGQTESENSKFHRFSTDLDNFFN